MIKIGLISDTHNYLDPQVFDYFRGCDEIWHAGDFGTIEIANKLKEIAPVLGVYGNIDGEDIRREYPLHQRFNRNGIDFLDDSHWRYSRTILHPHSSGDRGKYSRCFHMRSLSHP